MVTHAFTLSNQALAWLILNGIKPIENRQCKIQPGWYAVHIGATAHCSVEEEVLYAKEFSMPSVLCKEMERGMVHGVCKIGQTLPYDRCKSNRWAREDYKMCNIITEVIPFNKSVKATGNLGTWPLNKESAEQVRHLVMENLDKKKDTNVLSSLGLEDYGANESVKRTAPPAEDKPKKMKETPSVVNPKGDIRSFFQTD